MHPRLISDLVVSPNGFGFRADTGDVYRLNPTARQILEWLQEGEDEIWIAQTLAEPHQLPLPAIRRDLSAFFENLRNLHLVQPDDNL